MSFVQVYDPAMCCSTGVSGPPWTRSSFDSRRTSIGSRIRE